jgi:molybdopterin synthase catalytic subunit
MAFQFSRRPLDPALLRVALADPACGGFAAFEGWVRDHNDGLPVRRLEYEAFEPLALREGARILAEALTRFAVAHAACAHRVGELEVGELAVWVGVSARHRDEAFRACRYIIDEVKHRLPIWKKEHYANGASGWVNCERCASAAPHEQAPGEAPAHDSAHAHRA